MESEFASESDLRYVRLWASCPADFEKTEPSVASRVYQRMAGVGLARIEAPEIHEYLTGKRKMPAKHFEMIQDVFMCDCADDRDRVRQKYL